MGCPRRSSWTAAAHRRPARHFVLGVQWHPEADETSPIVGALVAAARGEAPEVVHATLSSERLSASYTPAPCAGRRAIRATAWGVVAAGVLAPVLRRNLKARPLAMQTIAFCAPVGLCVAMRRSRTRDVATCCLQMWAYVAAYKSPNDDPTEQARRVHIDYPIAIDRTLGLGELRPRACSIDSHGLARGPRVADARQGAGVGALVVVHGAPRRAGVHHVAPPERFDRAALLTYAVFDIGAMIYWVLPTAPPWYASVRGGGPTRTGERPTGWSRCGG